MDIFCKIMSGEIPCKTLYEDDIVRVILDVNPQGAGHSLIIPKVHYKDLYDIDIDTLNHIMKISKDILKLLNEKLNPNSIIVVQNNGDAQEVKHYHLHLVPKYDKELNYNVDEVFDILTK